MSRSGLTGEDLRRLTGSKTPDRPGPCMTGSPPSVAKSVAIEGQAVADGSAHAAASSTLARLEDQIGWYDRKSSHNQRWFKVLKICQLVLAAAIPVAAGESAPAWLVGGAGALIVVLEGVQQLQQYQQNWTSYRSTGEQLKHEKFLFLARAGPYATDHPEQQLAERIESLVSQEHAAWVSHREDAIRQSGGAAPH